jgi:hypothetical protein
MSETLLLLSSKTPWYPFALDQKVAREIKEQRIFFFFFFRDDFFSPPLSLSSLSLSLCE